MGMPVSKARYTVDDLEAMPDDGNRYEIIDGELFVTPAPATRHQWALMRLVARLLPWCDSVGRALFAAPTDVQASRLSQVEPDLFVVPRAVVFEGNQRWVPMDSLLLAVEILSPSTRRLDRKLKRTLYLGEGVPEYWIVDLDARTFGVWRPGASMADMQRESLIWHPSPDREPLVIDLVEYFREVLGSA